ncbi:MAG: glycosyltransferase [Plesiomonas sp.]|uniref:glycosyltransferase n=1 Tax=Plesiomonas sp. TaxID=2486279 RepID=UPI003F2BBDD9
MSKTIPETLHILHLIDLRKVGGVETMFCDFIRHEPDNDYKIIHSVLMDHDVIALPLQPRLTQVNSLSLKSIKYIHNLKLPNRPKLFRTWNRLRLIKNKKPDIILIWNQFTEWHLSYKSVCHFLSCPVVYYEHGMSWYQHQVTLPVRFFEHVDYCIAVSQAAKRMLQIKHSVNIPIDVELNAPRILPTEYEAKIPHKNKPLIFGSAGRLVPLKCLGLLIFTVKILNELNIPCHCYIAGDGPEKAYLEQTIQNLGISEQITLLGHIDDMSTFYQMLDIYICPSMHETGPLTALEAGAYGLPTITSYIDGLPEIVQHGITGLCLQPELTIEQYAVMTSASTHFSPLIYRPDQDQLTPPTMLSPQQIAEALIRLYHDPQSYTQMSAAALQQAKTNRNFHMLSESLLKRLRNIAESV